MKLFWINEKGLDDRHGEYVVATTMNFAIMTWKKDRYERGAHEDDPGIIKEIGPVLVDKIWS